MTLYKHNSSQRKPVPPPVMNAITSIMDRAETIKRELKAGAGLPDLPLPPRS